MSHRVSRHRKESYLAGEVLVLWASNAPNSASGDMDLVLLPAIDTVSGVPGSERHGICRYLVDLWDVGQTSWVE